MLQQLNNLSNLCYNLNNLLLYPLYLILLLTRNYLNYLTTYHLNFLVKYFRPGDWDGTQLSSFI